MSVHLTLGLTLGRHELREFAWACRSFGQAKALARAAAARGDRDAARILGRQARAEWQRVHGMLKLGGAL